MTSKNESAGSPHGLVGIVFEDFLKRLEANFEISPPLVERLRATLLDNRAFGAEALRNALFSED